MHASSIPPSRLTHWTIHPAIISMTLLLITTVTYNLWRLDNVIPTENGLLESGQLVFLILACLLSSYHAKVQFNQFPTERFLHIGLALFCFALILRECDIDQLGSSSNWKTLEIVLRSATLFAFIGFAGIIASKRSSLFLNFRILQQIPLIILALLGCVSYLASWPFDKELFNLPEALSIFIEESFELNACVLFFFASFVRRA